MPLKEVKDEFVMNAIIKLAIYFHCNGYIKDAKGVEKQRRLEEYLTSEEMTELMQDIEGNYVGIGVYIAQNTKTNQILVIGVKK